MTERLPPGLRWIAFDLDDTLHFYRRASGLAAEAVFAEAGEMLGAPVDDLREAYVEVLRTAQEGRFVEPKASREYRAERFEALLAGFGESRTPHLDRLLDVYDAALAGALELRPGARPALDAARRAGLSVMVVSEGPHDAQATTIDRLGIAPSVDLLVTSAEEGVSKSDGLLAKALERAGCECGEALYVGDSLQLDVASAAALGIACVYVGEGEPPDGGSAWKADLTTLAQLLDRLPARM